MSVVVCAQNPRNRFDFDFQSDWKWEQLFSKANNEKTETHIKNLKKKLSLEEAKFLLKQLSILQNQNDLRKFVEFKKLQVDLGGSFYGLLPDHFTDIDSIPTAQNFESLMETTCYLIQIREDNYTALSNPAFKYKTEFSLNPFPDSPNIKLPAGMKYEIDLSAITDLLALYRKNSATIEEAKKIAANNAFREMLKHRRSLGYVPEPLPDEDDLAQFIYLSASKKPLHLIWKWLNPCNYFGMADLYVNQDMYQKLIETLQANQESISRIVLGRISQITPNDLKYEDRLSYAVNFGIQSWATEFSLGTNLVSFKDDFNFMLETVTHETFHRVQLQICPVDSSRMKNKIRKFEDLTFYNFPDQKDQKFYEILSHIFLEGTATFVGGIDKSWLADKDIYVGKELFEQCYQEIYIYKDFQKSEELFHKGLKSNGPFYALGYHMSKKIVDRIDEKQLGIIISQGCLSFFNKFLEIYESDQNNKKSFFSSAIINRLTDMNTKL
jgi:hypothetical protein